MSPVPSGVLATDPSGSGRLCALLLLLCGFTVPKAVLLAQDVIPKIEYQAGHGGMDHKVKGSLLVSDSVVKFLDEKGAVLIVIPIKSIKGVSSSIDRKEASVGSKLAFGILAKSRKEELVMVSYESGETAEGLVFKTEKNMSAGLIAKLQFHIKRGGGPPPADSTTKVPHPPSHLRTRRNTTTISRWASVGCQSVPQALCSE